MARLVIIGVIIAVAFMLYALVDAAMSDPARSRGVPKPVWVVLIVVLPIVGAALWFIIGKGRGPAPRTVRAPDDDPGFTRGGMSKAQIDAHVEELEARLRELDEETFPGVDGDASLPGEPESSNGAAKPDGDPSGEQR